MKLVYTPRALRDLEGIATYLVERNPSAAHNVLTAIRSSIDVLAVFPKIGRAIDDMGRRRVPVLRLPYVVFYRVAADEVLILHIRHTSRHPSDLDDL